MDMLAQKSAGLRNFAEQYGIAINDPTLIRRYRMDQDARRDEATRIYAARAEVARRMKEDGIDASLISRYTGLSDEEVEGL